MSGLQTNTDLILTESDKKELAKIATKNPLVDKLYKIYQTFTDDPNKGWMNTIVYAQKEVQSLTLDKTLDITENGYHKSLWEMLKGGATVAKTIASAKQEANITSEPEKPKDEEEESIVPITAETAKR